MQESMFHDEQSMTDIIPDGLVIRWNYGVRVHDWLIMLSL